MRTIKVPWKKIDWFNKKLEINKHWDGTFSSPFGYGYCQGDVFKVIRYVFLEKNP
jgi:hypothetical protein